MGREENYRVSCLVPRVSGVSFGLRCTAVCATAVRLIIFKLRVVFFALPQHDGRIRSLVHITQQ